MAEYIHKTGGAVKATDAILDFMLSKRNERAMDTWKLNYAELLCDEMLVACESDRTAMVHELLFVIRGE